ncbi:MAG: immunoglobulin domain-containing protein [Verrucomicrobiota bacterium]
MPDGAPFSSPTANKNLSRMVMGGYWWTSAAGWRALPSPSSNAEVSKISSSGEWIVASRGGSGWRYPEPLMRWQVAAGETLINPVYMHVPTGWRVHSIARVLDDGRVIGTLKTVADEAYRNMDAFIWHANGRVESLMEAVRRTFGEEALPPVSRLGSVMSVTADGRRFAGARELESSSSVNEAAVAWSLSLNADLAPLPAAPMIQLFPEKSMVHEMGAVMVLNAGNAPLNLTAAVFEGDDAFRFTLAYQGVATPFQPVMLEPGGSVKLSYLVDDGNLDRSAVLRLTCNDPRPDAGVIEVHHESVMMPRIGFNGLAPIIETTTDRMVEVPISVWCGSDYRNVTVTGLGFDVDEGAAAFSEIVPNETFDLARNTSREVTLKLLFDEPGTYEVLVHVTGPADCGLPEPRKVIVHVSPQAALQWVAEDGVTVLNPETDVIDAGQVTVNSTIYMPVRLKNTGLESVSLISRSGNSTDDPFRGPLDNVTSLLPPPPVTLTLTGVSPGQTVTKYLRVAPKNLGVQEGTVRLDSRGQFVSPMVLTARCTGIAAGAPVFLDQPQSVFVSQEGPRPPVRVVGSQQLNAVLSSTGSSWTKSLSIDYQSRVLYSAMPGAWTLKVTNSQGTGISQAFYVAQLPGGPRNSYFIRTGEQLNLSTGATGPGLSYQWWHGEQKLTDTNGYAGSRAAVLRVASVKDVHAGDYSCEVTLTGPDRTLAQTVQVATVDVNDPSLNPRVEPFSLRRAREGEFISFSIGALGRSGKATITGLPPGMRQTEAGGFNVSGFISLAAAATKPVTYKVKVVVRSGTLVSPVFEVPWVIEPYEDAGLAGTYHGLMEQMTIPPLGGRVIVTMSTAGSGSFSWEGDGMVKASGRVILVGRGPPGLPAQFDPPLPVGMEPPSAAHALVCVGKGRPGEVPPSLVLIHGPNMLVGGLSSPESSVLAFRLTKPVAALVPGNKTTVYTQVLEHEEVEGKTWREVPPENMPNGPGVLGDAVTFLDQRQRLHLFGSKLNTAYDHWMWDPKGRKWTDARTALNIPANDPVPPREPDPTLWRSPSGADSWLYTKQGALWRWSGADGRWQMVQAPLPLGSAGEPGVLGVSSPQSRPRGRQGATTWLQANGELWMYGGRVPNPATGSFFSLVDLWCFQPATQQWTWMAGRTLLPSEGPDWRSDGILQPASDAAFCPCWVDHTGRLWMHELTSSGQQRMWTFDLVSKSWSMPYSQAWDGVIPGHSGTSRETGPPETGTSPGKRSKNALCWTDAQGNLMLFGGFDSGVGAAGYNRYPDFYIWRFNIQQNAWTCLGFVEEDGLDAAGWGITQSQTWKTASGHLYMRGGIIRLSTVNLGDSNLPGFLEFSDVEPPDVPGFLASTLTTAGALSWVGRLPDGEPVTGASVISRFDLDLPAEGLTPGMWVTPCYSTLTHKKSSLLGLLSFKVDGSCCAHLSWSRPYGASIATQRVLPAGFPALELEGQGWRYDTATWAQNLPAQGLPLDQLAGLPATDLLLTAKAQRLVMTLAPWSPSSPTVTFVPATGFFSLKGKIGTQPKTSREFQLHGLLLPKIKSAAGQFTVPLAVDSLIVPKQTETTTEIQIGGF